MVPWSMGYGVYLCAIIWRQILLQILLHRRQAIHGAKYQWGAQTGDAGRYISQTDDQSMASVSGWINTVITNTSLWGNTNKGPNDPCPNGYRVPAQSEWAAVVNENKGTRVGNWGLFNPTVYGSAYYFSSATMSNSLMLPAAGYRGNGTILYRGQEADYWSGTAINTLNAMRLYIDQSSVTSGTSFNGAPTTQGFSVRCISE